MWKLIYKNKSGEWKRPSYKISLTHLTSPMLTSVRERNVVTTGKLKQNLPLFLALMQIHKNKSQMWITVFLTDFNRKAYISCYHTYRYLRHPNAWKMSTGLSGSSPFSSFMQENWKLHLQPGKWGHWYAATPVRGNPEAECFCTPTLCWARGKSS